MSITYPDLNFTTYPDSIQDIPTMLDITISDADIIQQYQQAIQNKDFELAQQLIVQVPQYAQKLITARLINTINDTCVAVERFFASRYSPAYIVSETEPVEQEIGDYWFEVVGSG